jgi:hypothetical protein
MNNSNNPNSLSYMVSSVDLKRKIKHKFKLIQYDQLYLIKSIFELLPRPNTLCIILLNVKQNSGHWTLIFRTKTNLIIYIDSYGKKPDGELKYIQNKKFLHENKPYLTFLLNKAHNQGYNLIYNRCTFQKYNNNINTCGKYIVYFSNGLFKGYSLPDLQNYLINLHKQYNEPYDLIINEIYNNQI